jgi:hypothetical protein
MRWAAAAVLVMISTVALLVGQMRWVPWFLAGVGALLGLVLAVYEGIKEKFGDEDWYAALLVYPLLMGFSMFVCGLLILFLYNLIAHGPVGLHYP